MIRALLGRPGGVGEWLAVSFVGSMSLLGLWIAAAGFLLLAVVTQQTPCVALVRYLSDLAAPVAITTHWLLWWQVLRGAWAMSLDEGHDDWLLAGAVLWWLVLGGFQLLCLACWFSPYDAASGPPWLQF